MIFVTFDITCPVHRILFYILFSTHCHGSAFCFLAFHFYAIFLKFVIKIIIKTLTKSHQTLNNGYNSLKICKYYLYICF